MPDPDDDALPRARRRPGDAPQTNQPEKREKVIVHMAAGLLGACRYFRVHREAYAGATFTSEPRRNAPKVGRNDPCPCGSGKKYKRCCGGTTTNSFVTP